MVCVEGQLSNYIYSLLRLVLARGTCKKRWMSIGGLVASADFLEGWPTNPFPPN